MSQKFPFFSVIVPTYNRPTQIAACLQSLTRLDYPLERFEVIVVDDGSETPLETIVSSFGDRLNVRLLTQSHTGPSAARNQGAEKAKGDFLAFTDDDCTPAPDWLPKLADRFVEVPDHAIGGRTINTLSKNLFSFASQILIDFVYAYYNANPDQARFFASNNLTLPANLFHEIGGFDVTFTAAEDRDICDRWRHHGFLMIYAPEVLVYHSHVLNFRNFWRQHFNYGRGAYRYHRARFRRGVGPFRPDLKFYMKLLCYPFLEVQFHRALLFSALLVVSQMATVVGFLREGFNQVKRG